jgi:hypothetical protein
VDFYSTKSNSNQIYNIASFKTNTAHIHYEPLIMESNDHVYNVHSVKTLVHPNKKWRINCNKSKHKLTIQSTHKNDTSNLIDFCKEQCNRNTCINNVLNRNIFCKLQAFSYTPGNFLFNTFQVLLHFHYSSIELQNGLIDHLFDA